MNVGFASHDDARRMVEAVTALTSMFLQPGLKGVPRSSPIYTMVKPKAGSAPAGHSLGNVVWLDPAVNTYAAFGADVLIRWATGVTIDTAAEPFGAQFAGVKDHLGTTYGLYTQPSGFGGTATQVIYHGKADAQINPGFAGTVSVYRIVGTEVDTGVNITVQNWLNQTIPANANVIAGYDSLSAAYYIIWAETIQYAVEGILDGALVSGGTATMSIWHYNGTTYVDSGTNITVRSFIAAAGGRTLPAGLGVVASWTRGSTPANDGYRITATDCI